MTLHPGTRVRLNTPSNPRLHGALAEIDIPTAWGALVRTPAAATGQYRAAHCEIVPEGANGSGPVVVPTGDVCRDCGSPEMVRTGTCLTCQACGSTSGGCA